MTSRIDIIGSNGNDGNHYIEPVAPPLQPLVPPPLVQPPPIPVSSDGKKMGEKEIIDVVQAYLNGEAIEFKLRNSKNWNLADRPTWDFTCFDYRVRREPRTVYVNVYADGSMSEAKIYSTALDYPQSCNGVKMVEFIEVIEDE